MRRAMSPIAVSLFFILSGFVLTHSARAPESARAFWLRRFFTIYPNHLAGRKVRFDPVCCF